MILEEINRKDWERYEQIAVFRQKHPHLHLAGLWFLILLSFGTAFLVIGGIVWIMLRVCAAPGTGIVLLVNAVFTITFYLAALRNRPWKQMMKLEPRDYPELYRKVNWIACRMKAPKIHRIYLSAEFNASVGSMFTFVPGLRTNVLMIGYPLLCSLSSKGVIAVLAHEFGHVSGGHLSRQALFFHIRLFWEGLELGLFDLLLYPWKRCFLRNFDLLLHPLRRSFEQEADRRIVEYFGRAHQLEAMARTAMCSRIIAGDRTLQQLMMTHSAEEIDFAAAIRSALTRECSYDECRNGLTAALAEIPPVFDEHPPFRERVGKYNDAEKLMPYATADPDALEKLLHPGKVFYEQLNDYYRRFFTDEISALHADCEEYAARLAAFDPEAVNDEPEAIRFLEFLESIGREKEYEQLLAAARKRFPGSLSLRGLSLVRQLEQSGTEEGQKTLIAQMEMILSEAPLMIYQLNDPLMNYYLRHGENESIKRLLDLRDSGLRREQHRLMQPLSVRDDLRPAGWNDYEKEEVRKAFANNALQIEAVYPVQRYYDSNVQVSTLFLVIRKRRMPYRSFRFQRSDQDLISDYEVLDGKVVIGTPELLAHLDSQRIEPVLIPLRSQGMSEKKRQPEPGA